MCVQMSPMPSKTKAGHPLKTPIRLRSDSNLGRWNSPRAALTSMKEVAFYPAPALLNYD